MRALFSPKKASPKPITRTNAASGCAPPLAALPPLQDSKNNANISTNNNEKLEAILALPMPKIYPDAEYDHMDVFAAASLNSEIVERYIGDDSCATQLANALNVHRWTPLMYAAYLGHSEMTQLLLTRGADPQTQNEGGQTATMMAASCGSIDVVNVLMKAGAKINCQDRYGRSPLHYAIKYNQSSIAGLLLEKYDADSNLPDFEEMTPTLTACEVGNESTVDTLLRYGGDPNRRNRRGENGFALALDHPKVLAALKSVRLCGTTPTATNIGTNTTTDSYSAEKPRQSSDIIINNNPPTAGQNVNNDGVIAETTNLVDLLGQMGLEKYSKTLADKGVKNLGDLAALTDERLTEIGITLFGPRKKILNMAEKYRQFERLTTGSVVNIDASANNSPTENPWQARIKENYVLEKLIRENYQLNLKVHALMVDLLPHVNLPNHNFDIKTILTRIEMINMKLISVIKEEQKQ